MTDTELLLDPKTGKRLYAPVDLLHAAKAMSVYSGTPTAIATKPLASPGEYEIRPARFDRPVRTLAMQLAGIRQFDEQKKAK